MAKIVITTWGSAGDLNPYLAVGLGLKARGHAVLFAVDASFCAPLEAAGFATHRLSGDLEAAFMPHGREMFGSRMPMTPIRLVFSLYVLPTLRAHRGVARGLRRCRPAHRFWAAGRRVVRRGPDRYRMGEHGAHAVVRPVAVSGCAAPATAAGTDAAPSERRDLEGDARADQPRDRPADQRDPR